MKALLGLLLLYSQFANAETWISTSLLSYHFDRHDKKNERNYGIGLEHDYSARARLVAGIYKNPNRIDSGYLGAVGCVYRTTNWCAGALAGGVTGYERYTILMGGLVLSYEQKGWGVNLVAFPKDGGVAALQLKRRF